jgi:iron(III) transport system ATP-binding protein
LSAISEPPGNWRSWGRRGTAGAAIPADLRFENVSMRYGDVDAVDGVSLTVKAGEIICLLGQSGCGKTTLLRMAAGIETPSAGTISLDGRVIAGPGKFVEPEDRGIGLVFQDYALFPHLDVLHNVQFGLKALGRELARATALRALERVGLAGHANAYPHMLSGGEQQRVALARAVAPRPGVLLMDEPFSNLDRRLKDEVRDETVALLRETRATTIVVTHDPDDAMRIADRIVLMRKGRIVQAGPAQELYNKPADLFVARFFCDFNEIDAVVESQSANTAVGRFAAPALADGTRVKVCIRPASIRLKAPGFCLPGRITGHRFMGDTDMVQVAVSGVERPLTLRLRAETPLRLGQDVGIEIIAEEVLVFDASGP